MNRVEAALRGIAADLDDRRSAWALVGGFAVSARAEPRFTRDVDVAVAVGDDAAVEALVASLVSVGYRAVAVVEQEAVGRLATARLIPSGSTGAGVVVDLLFATSGVEPEIVAAAEPLEILPGLCVPVARTGHLMAMKLLARDDDTRPQDVLDLRALREVAGYADVALARATVELVVARGFGRGRDLARALAALVDQ